MLATLPLFEIESPSMPAPTTMKALSVRQPHAERIRRGTKTLEIRSWNTRYRGPLLICSSHFKPADAIGGGGAGPLGVARCTVHLVNSRPFTPEDATRACVPYAPNLFAWELADPQPTPALPVKGRLGFFPVTLPNTSTF